jgi:hypothetical protein
MKPYEIFPIKTDEGNKVFFTIPSLDRRDIRTRYKTMRRAVKGISRKIRSFEKDYAKASEISPKYARDYCFNDFEVKYAGKESDIFSQTLATVQEGLNKERNDNRVSKEIIKRGVFTAIPVVGEVTSYKGLKENGLFDKPSGKWAYGVSTLVRVISMPLLLFGYPTVSGMFYTVGSIFPFGGNLVEVFDKINETERSNDFEIEAYMKKPVASTA